MAMCAKVWRRPFSLARPRLFRRLPLLRVALAPVGHLLAPVRDLVARVSPAVALVGETLSLIRQALPLVGHLVALVCDPFSLPGSAVALRRRSQSTR